MNKYIMGVLALAFILGIALLIPKNEENVGPSEILSTISVNEETHDFGDIDIYGGKVRATYVLKNEGTEDVRIVSGVTSCMCTEGEIGGFVFGMHESSGKRVVIPAGGEEILTATFDPLAHGPGGTGKIKREVFLKSNSNTTPEIKVTFTANVVKSAQ